MINRLTSILLCLCLLLLPAAAQAEQTEEVIKFNDDFSYSFENSATLRDNMFAKGWEQDTLNIWDSAAFETMYNCTYSMVDDGAEGTALQLTRDVCLPDATTPEYDFTDDTLRCSLRLKIMSDSIPEGNDNSYILAVGAGYHGKFFYARGGKLILQAGTEYMEAEYELNRWYTVSCTIRKSEGASLIACAVYNEDGSEFIATAEQQAEGIAGQLYFGEGSVGYNSSGDGYGYTYAIDDAVIEAVTKYMGTMEIGKPEFDGDGNMTVGVTFKNNSAARVYGWVVAALSYGERLMWCEAYDVGAIPVNTEAKLYFSGVPYNAEDLSLSLYLWDRLESMRPLYMK